MRREIDSIPGREGWTKEALDKMSKVDSFIKESMRLSSTSTCECTYWLSPYCLFIICPIVSMMRKTLKPFTVSNGTVIPPGVLIFVPGQARHMDPSIYPTPDLFDGFRFSNLEKEQQGNDSGPLTANLSSTLRGARFKLVTTTPDYLAWGYGRHACSGRFFAALVLKLMLAHLVSRYDIKFENLNGGDARPEDVTFGFNRLPDPHAKLLLRRRR